MSDKIGKWLITGRFSLYYASSFLTGLMISLYLTYTRAVIGGAAGEEKYGIVVFLGAMESIPGLLSIIFGFASDFTGRRKALLSGLLSSFFLLLFPLADTGQYPLLALGVFTGYYVFWSTLFGIILDYTGGRGRPLSLFGLAGSLGWSSGGILVGFISPYGAPAVFGTAAMVIGVASITAFLAFPSSMVERSRPGLNDLLRGIRMVSALFIGYLIGSAGVSIYINTLGVRLFELMGENMVAYGIVFSTLTGILGAVSRPLAGIAVDKTRPEKVLLAVFLLYLVSSLIMMVSPPLLIVIAVWLIPLYPFYETSALTSTSRRLSAALQATAAGIVSTGTSMSGFLNIVASSIIGEGGYTRSLAIAATLLSASIIVMLINMARRGEG